MTTHEAGYVCERYVGGSQFQEVTTCDHMLTILIKCDKKIGLSLAKDDRCAKKTYQLSVSGFGHFIVSTVSRPNREK